MSMRYIQNPSDDFILFKNATRLSMCLTPYHEVLVRNNAGELVKHPALLLADSLLGKRGFPGYILHSFRYENECHESKFASENEYRLQVAFCADGTLLPENGTWGGRIQVKREYKKERLRLLLQGLHYKETECENGCSNFWFNPPLRSRSLYECFHDEDFAFLRDEVFKWDGDEEHSLFRTTHKEDADFIQFVLTSGGCAAGISEDDRLGEIYNGKYERKSILYTVNQYEANVTAVRRVDHDAITVECLPEKAPSYCFTVPSHNLVIRHNDRIFITGNCGKDLSKADVSVNIYAFLKAQQTGEKVELSCAIGDETVDGLPYSLIVDMARGYILGVGGFEKFAEWGLIRPSES